MSKTVVEKDSDNLIGDIQIPHGFVGGQFAKSPWGELQPHPAR